MTRETSTIGPDEALEALASIQVAEKAGLSRSIPPLWFGIAMSLIAGGLLAAGAAGETTLVPIFIAAMVGAIAFRRHKTGIEPRTFPSRKISIIAISALIVFAIGLMFAARVLVEMRSLEWAPLAAGGVLALLVFGLAVSERRTHMAAIRSDDAS